MKLGRCPTQPPTWPAPGSAFPTSILAEGEVSPRQVKPGWVNSQNPFFFFLRKLRVCEKRCLLGYIACSFLLSRWEIRVNVSSERLTVQTPSHFLMFLQKCVFMLGIRFLSGKIFGSVWRAVGARLPLRL